MSSKPTAAGFAFHSRRSTVYARHGMVATSQPLAAQAGLRVLQQGGNAADAAVAAAAMMAVVEPVSCGLGGDCFALYFDAQTGRVTALNGSGRSGAATDAAALRAAGHVGVPLYTGAAVTVPGAVRAWHDLLQRHGTQPWERLLLPAAETAEKGFAATDWIAAAWKLAEPRLRREPGWAEGEQGPAQESGLELLPGGRAPAPGQLVRLPTLAGTLKTLAAKGPGWFYSGKFAQELAAYVRSHGGWLEEQDLARHEGAWQEPLTCQYRGVTVHECPPNGQGLAALLACNIAHGFDLAAMDEPARVHHGAECMRLALADARQWVADPGHSKVPLNTLLSTRYAARRRTLVNPRQAGPGALPGELPAGSDTIYLAVVDGAGNACSLIQSLYMGVGTGLVVPGTGVCLQNRGAGFALQPGHVNELAPGKRPYHTIIPALTTRGGRLHACFGVMGGFMQPQGHFQVLVNLLDLGLDPQQALDAPRWQLPVPGDSTARLLLEDGFGDDVVAELARRGHHPEVHGGFARIHFGGGQIITRDPATGVLAGGSDPRKDGCAAGW